MVLLFFIITGLAPKEFIVLKNGKTMACESYVVKGDQVHVTTSKNTFSLPVRLVDWEAGKKKKERWEAAQAEKKEQARQEEIRKSAAKALGPSNQEKAPIILTSKEYREMAESRASQGETVIPFRKMGNAIIVNAVIHGQGPFQFLLDTGASLTVVSPELAKRLRLVKTGETVRMVGVAGEVVEAPYCMINDISLGGARVENLKVSIRGIPQLNKASIIGLLGQDYLENFVMNLDSAKNQLRLTPHSVSADFSETRKQDAEILKDPIAPFRKLQGAFTDLDRYYSGWFAGYDADLRHIKEIINRLGESRSEATDVYSLYNKMSTDHLSPDQARSLKKFLRCYPGFNSLVGEMAGLARQLRTAYSRTTRDEQTARSLRNAYDSIVRAQERFNNCISQ